MSTSKITVGVRDHSDKLGSCSLRTFNFNGLDGATLLATRLAFKEAVDALSLGKLQTATISDTNVEGTFGDIADTDQAQRDTKMVFKMRDAVNPAIKSELSVPAADTQWEVSGSNDVDQTAIPVAAMIAIIESTGQSIAGNAVEVYDVVMG